MKLLLAKPQSALALANPFVLTCCAGADIQMNDHLIVDEHGCVLPAPNQHAIRTDSNIKVPGYIGMAVETKATGEAIDVYTAVKDQIVVEQSIVQHGAPNA